MIDLEAAGVSKHVIDVVVAVSFPDQFALNRGDVEERQARRPVYAAGPGYGWGGFRRSLFYDPFYYGYGYGYPGYYGYSYGRYGGYAPARIYVGRSAGSTGGRVVQGRGYTQRRGGTVSGGSSGGSYNPPRARSGGSNPPARVRSGGSSGGKASSGGRKARRRGGS